MLKSGFVLTTFCDCENRHCL